MGALEFMPKNKKGEGFHSAAGLIRYFDSEDDKALKVNPWIVVVLCIAVSVLVLALDAFYPT
jgi:preprotein translocase subunit Sec61beta